MCRLVAARAAVGLGVLAGALAGLLAAGCAGRCPRGTSPRGGMPPSHQVQWCEGPADAAADDAAAGRPPQITTSHRTGELAPGVPSRVEGRAIEGPLTTWHASGSPAAHGRYAPRSGGSLPHGIWTTWYETGQRRSQGRLHEGEPVGCFALWNSLGMRATAVAAGGELRPRSCEPPRHEAADRLEAAAGGAARPRGDIAVSLFEGPGHRLGARTMVYTPRDPGMTQVVALTARGHLGATRVGGAASLRLSDVDKHLGAALTAVLARALLDPRGRLGLEPQLELGAQVVFARPSVVIDGLHHQGRQSVWTPLAAAELQLSWRLGALVEVVAAPRLELRYPRDAELTTKLCTADDCVFGSTRWKTGGASLGASVGARMILW